MIVSVRSQYFLISQETIKSILEKTRPVHLFLRRYSLVIRKKLGNLLDHIDHDAMENDEKKFVVTLR
jgi:hypothetical protein